MVSQALASTLLELTVVRAKNIAALPGLEPKIMVYKVSVLVIESQCYSPLFYDLYAASLFYVLFPQPIPLCITYCAVLTYLSLLQDFWV